MRALKKFIRSKIKYFLWVIFKSPQRKLGWYTLWLDVAAYAIYIFQSIVKPAKLQPISICVGIYNRGDIFLKYFLPSLLKCNHLSLIELSVFDAGSTDINNLRHEIESIFKGKLAYTFDAVPFTRSRTFNRAVDQSTSKKIFLCDADFSLPVDLVNLCNRYTPHNTVWFPIVFYLYKNRPAYFEPNNGEWMLWGGKGLLACNKSDFDKVGKLNESYTEWGYEDEELWLRFYANKYFIIRSRCKELLHHWHSSLNPKYKRLEELVDRGLL